MSKRRQPSTPTPLTTCAATRRQGLTVQVPTQPPPLSPTSTLTSIPASYDGWSPSFPTPSASEPSSPLDDDARIMSTPLLSAPQPRAVVNLPAKAKDCPTLSAGRMDPDVFSQWTRACKRYQKHAGKTDTEIVSLVADAMLEPRLAAWYNAQQARIDALTLNEYLTELANLTLPRNWQNKLRNDILASRMDDDPAHKFLDWVVTLQNSNATLQLVGSKLALTDDALKAQIEANVSAELKASLETDPLWASQLDHWIPLVSDRDDYLRAETEKMQALIDAHDARRRASKATRPPLSSRITDPRPALADRITSASAPTSAGPTARTSGEGNGIKLHAFYSK
ncbi:hypothetical protein AURDEDRAFT_159776 [Auricularia subglabra TFB-10046 SS5]|nr:hypothetical protein AURDEDRAFT_159776 [Auricularia subglabra TFB-10046 SS5]